MAKGRLFVIDNKTSCLFVVDSQVLAYENELAGIASELERTTRKPLPFRQTSKATV